MLISYECNAATKENMALSGRTLYFVHWIGHPDHVCNASMALPAYRLLLVPRSELPSHGTITVELQIQSASSGDTHSVATTVDLG